MLCVHGSPLYQWDRNRQLLINAVDIDSKFEVHCCHTEDSNALVVVPIIEGDAILVNIPNILLQRSGYLRVYVVTEGDTIYDQTFYVMARQKPDDYVYTETEVLSYSSLEKRIAELEKGGVSGEQIAEAVGEYLDENPIAETDPNVPNWAKQPEKPTYTAEEVGALPSDTHIPSIDGLATEQYVDDAIANLPTGGGGSTYTTLWSGSVSNNCDVILSDSVLNYKQIIIVACISGNPMYQFTGIFYPEQMVDINESSYQQCYLSTPFEINSGGGTISAICTGVADIYRENKIRWSSINKQWKSANMLAVIGVN